MFRAPLLADPVTVGGLRTTALHPNADAGFCSATAFVKASAERDAGSQPAGVTLG
jgi:hypothetical protein